MFLSTVEASSHALKDCEALGFTSTNPSDEYVFSGKGDTEFATKNGLRYGTDFVRFNSVAEIPAEIMKDFGHTILDRLVEMFDRGRENILFSHAPPLGCCDLTPKRHAGSRDVLEFLKNNPLRACFAGHIHTGVDLSGTWQTLVGKCKVACPGGSGVDVQLMNRVNFITYDTSTDELERVSYAVDDFDLCF